MKFLVLALCVCAASAASFGSTPFGSGSYKQQQFKGFPKAAAAAVVAPAVFTAKAAEAAAPEVTPVAAAAAATYEAGSTGYQTAKAAVNKGYSDESQANIVRSDSEVSADSFNYVYETGNGISGQASGKLVPVGDAAVLVSQGAFRYISPDGTPVEVTYTADENGYHPQSDVLPVGPAIPDAILRSLAYIEAKTKEVVQKY